MKYMKLGSKSDTFQAAGGTVTTVAAELPSDMVIQVEDTTFHLHKFPLLSKCGKLQRLVAESGVDTVRLQEIPGGSETFELCAKFCYGITIVLNAYNVIIVRCAAEYLGMTENIEKGNLIFKVEVFLNSSIFKGWKDSIIALNTTKTMLPWSQDLKLVNRCIDTIASKTSVDPSTVDWSFTDTRSTKQNEISACRRESDPGNGARNCETTVVSKDWWVEDIRDLEIDLYWRVMVAIKSKGRMPPELIGEALRVYAGRWLSGISKDPDVVNSTSREGNSSSNCESGTKHKFLLERVVSLLPIEKGSCSCSFLSRLLKAACIVGARNSSKMELARRVGLQLEEASVKDLLIPSTSEANDESYDVDLVQHIVDQFLIQQNNVASGPEGQDQTFIEKRGLLSADKLDFKDDLRCTTHSSNMRVAKLIDGYLAEIARDKNLSLAKFIALAESIPSFARPVNDGLYRAIDIFLKEHPGLTKSDRKKICRRMDCKKLSMNACMHAAQNERLPLRVIVQLLFFVQVRTARTGAGLLIDAPSNVPQGKTCPQPKVPQGKTCPQHGGDESIQPMTEWEPFPDDKYNFTLKGSNSFAQGNVHEDMEVEKNSIMQHSRSRNLVCSSKRILARLLSIKNSSSSGSKDSDESKSSETSGSSVAMDAKNS